jgi:Concanavalin A-like lectin/glucanases superfamily/Domain of unknown function (DUF2341)
MTRSLVCVGLLLVACNSDDTRPGPAHPVDAGGPEVADAAEPGAPDAAPPACTDAWKYQRTLRLDTSASGAAVPGDVSNFPLALQLDAASFDFAQAKPDGSDVRFFAADGTPLAHAVELWDAQAGRAALWVKLPKVAGNQAGQALVMRWGNPDAENVADAHAVFSVDDGFVAAWHLGEEGSTAAGGYKDATANGAHATGVALGAADRVDGRVGKAVSLHHDRHQWLRVDGSANNQKFNLVAHSTYSIWTYANSHTVEYQCAFSRGETGFRLHYYGAADWDDNMGKHIVESCTELVGGADLCPLKGGENAPWKGTDVAPGKWWHWTVVNDYPKIHFYLNGVEEVSLTSVDDWTSGAAKPVGIGNNTNHTDGRRSWDGYLDEARVLNVAKDASWVKLDYESQREGQKLVTFGAVESCAQ